MNLSELIATMPNEPTSSDGEVQTWLRESITEWRDIAQAEMLRWCATYNIIKRFETLGDDPDTVIQSVAKAGLVLITSPNGLEASNAETRQMMTLMQTKAMVTGAELANLSNRAQVSLPRWQRARDCTREPSLDDIAHARAN